MEIAKDRAKGPRRLGELLIAAKVVKKEVLDEALHIAKGSKTLIGRTLMSIGELREADLQAALELQDMLKEGMISMDFGLRALQLACQARMPLRKAFIQLGWQPPAQTAGPVSELGELLLEAGLVNQKLLMQAIQQSRESNLALGRCLVVNCVLSPTLLSSAFTAQVLLRDGKVTRDQAVAGLKIASLKQQSIEKALQDAGSYAMTLNEIKLGDLLSAAGIVAEGDKITAVEVGLQHKELVGQVLLQAAMVSQPVLEDALKLQALVREGKINAPQAIEFLKHAHATGVNVDTLLEERKKKQSEVNKTNDLIEFLCLANVISIQEIDDAQLAARLGAGSTIGEVLVTQGVVDAHMLEAATQARVLVQEQMIPFEQAARALVYCRETKVDFPKAIEDMSWAVHQAKVLPPKEEKKNWFANLWSKLKRD